MERVRLAERVAFEAGRMVRHRLLATPRAQADLYCLAPGQAQAPHAHAEQDKLYLGVEGRARVRVGGEAAWLEAGDLVLAPAGIEHGVENPGDAPCVLLVVVVPPPPHA